MDRNEYEMFAQAIGLTPQNTTQFWLEMAHRSGDNVVDADEFIATLKRERALCRQRSLCPDLTAEPYCVKWPQAGALADGSRDANSARGNADLALSAEGKGYYHPVVFRTPTGVRSWSAP